MGGVRRERGNYGGDISKNVDIHLVRLFAQFDDG